LSPSTLDLAQPRTKMCLEFFEEGEKLLENDAIAPSAARLCWAAPSQERVLLRQLQTLDHKELLFFEAECFAAEIIRRNRLPFFRLGFLVAVPASENFYRTVLYKIR
jgi:hypothetical protein